MKNLGSDPSKINPLVSEVSHCFAAVICLILQFSYFPVYI